MKSRLSQSTCQATANRAHQRVGQIFVEFRIEACGVVEQIAVRAVIHHHVKVVELFHKRIQAAQCGVREHFAIDELSAHEYLRAIARNEIHAIGHGLEKRAQRIVTTDPDAATKRIPAASSARTRSNVSGGTWRALVKQRAVHVTGNEFNVFIRFHMRASFRLAPEPFGRPSNSSWCSHSRSRKTNRRQALPL